MKTRCAWRSRVALAWVLLALLTGCSSLTGPRPEAYRFPAYIPEPPREAASPGSLWQGEGKHSLLFADHKARRLNDIVTIRIVESAKGSKSATTQTSRETTHQTAITKLFGLPTDLGIRNLFGLGTAFSPSLDASSTSEFDGSGTTTREGTLTATLTARVVEVFPNGNLRIAGKREVVINNERQYLILTGIIRPEDINANNEVASTAIADAQILYTGRGVLDEKQAPGWLTRFLDKVWPF